jgi:hypothetical protein
MSELSTVSRSALAFALVAALTAGAASAQTVRPYGVRGSTLYNLLRADGVTLTLWPQQSLTMFDQDDAGDGHAIGLANGALKQRGSDQCQYSMVWDQPQMSVSFNRSQLKAGHGGVAHPVWTATAFDYIGRPLGSVGELAIHSRRDVPAHRFTLKAAGIKQVVFWGDNRGADGLCNVAIDTLDTSTATG